MIAPRPVGVRRDGRPVHAWTLAAAGGLESEVWDHGALLKSLTCPLADGRRVETTQAPPDLAGVEADTAYHGVVVGRVANRISGAAFTLDGRRHALPPNEGRNLLHSGAAGWSRALWRFTENDPLRCALELTSPDGEGGFPGEVRARVTMSLPQPDTLEIAWEAEASAPTPVAMTHHLYFNLSGGAEPTIRDHTLRIAADGFTPVGEGLIPTGEVVPVAGTPFDLRAPRRIADVVAHDDPQLALGGGGLDLNWALSSAAAEALTLRSPASGLSLHLATDQPGMQVFTGQTLPVPFSAVALEPQDFPDAVNRPAFPSAIVRPGAPHRRVARYRFEAGG